jgi:hypothetical protein
MEFLNTARCTFVVHASQRAVCVAHIESLGGAAAQVYTHEQAAAFRKNTRGTRKDVVILIGANCGDVDGDGAPHWFAPDGPFQWLLSRERKRVRVFVASIEQWHCCTEEDRKLFRQAYDASLRCVGLHQAYVPPPSFGKRNGERILLAVCAVALVAGAAAAAFAVMFS